MAAGGILCFPCVAIRNFISQCAFKWKRRRYSWRAAVYYEIAMVSMFLGVLCTVIFHFLLAGKSFFTNYVCSEDSVGLINANTIGMIILASILGVFSLLISRLTRLFSNYTMSDFMSSGKWADRLGCLVKWIPWGMAVIALVWGIVNIINVGLIFGQPGTWCQSRWTPQGEKAVRNCRMFTQRTEGCTTVSEEVPGSLEDTIKCNSEEYLESSGYFKFVPKATGREAIDSPCSFTRPVVCLAFAATILGTSGEVSKSAPELEACLQEEQNWANFVDADNASDLYRYLQLYVILWSVLWAILVLLFYYIKKISYYDAIFFQAYEDSENIIVKTIKPLTPWSG